MSNVGNKEEQLKNQMEYLKTAPKDEVGLAEDKYLIQSMRSTRYTSESQALADLVDNAIEATAGKVSILYNVISGNKISEIAVVDNGCGMYPDMLKHAVRWGGSTRYGSRNLFGRFGFGLPSASLKHGTSYTVFSRIDESQEFYAVTVDFKEIEKRDGRVYAPNPIAKDLPIWVKDKLKKEGIFDLSEVRTVVLLTDRTDLVRVSNPASAVHTIDHFGVTYSAWLNQVLITVDGIKVEPVDPLFITPGNKYYEMENNGVITKAEDHSIPDITIRDKHGVTHSIKVRLSLIRKNAWEAKDESTSGNQQVKQKRLQIKKNYNGILMYRNNRYIETVKWPEITWNNYARQVGIAIHFPAELDEFFGITPDKQTIVLSNVVEEQLLGKARLKQAFNSLANEVMKERQKNEIAETTSAAERVAAKLDKIKPIVTASPEKEKEKKKNLERIVRETAAQTGLPEETIRQEFEKNQAIITATTPYQIQFFEGRSGEPFYEPQAVGAQVLIRINTNHPFFTETYVPLKNSSSEAKAGVELLLVLLARAEVDSTGERRAWYMQERINWSEELGKGLVMLPDELRKGDSNATAAELSSSRNEIDEE